MGCRQSYFNYTEELDVNDGFHDLNQAGNIPEVDSRLPLDARQAFKLKQSWKGIRRNIEHAGLEMFVR